MQKLTTELEIHVCQMLSYEYVIHKTPSPRLRDHCQREGGKVVRAKGGESSRHEFTAPVNSRQLWLPTQDLPRSSQSTF